MPHIFLLADFVLVLVLVLECRCLMNLGRLGRRTAGSLIESMPCDTWSITITSTVPATRN